MTKGKGVGLFYLLWLCNNLYPKTYRGKWPFIMLMESLGQEFGQSQWRWLVSVPWRLVPPLKSFRSGNWKCLSLGSKDRSHISFSQLMLAVVQGCLSSSPCDLSQLSYVRLSYSRVAGWVPSQHHKRRRTRQKPHHLLWPSHGSYTALFPLRSLGHGSPKAPAGSGGRGIDSPLDGEWQDAGRTHREYCCGWFWQR